MKNLLVLCAILFSVTTANAESKVIRIECGVDGLPNPHGGDKPYIGLYRYGHMNEFRMVFFKYPDFQFDGPIDPFKSDIGPVSTWPKLTAVLRHEEDGKNYATEIKIDAVLWKTAQQNDPKTIQFEATGTLNSDYLKNGYEVPLECQGLYELN